jgi:hypothetical protein
MDPLSITASTIALISALKATSKVIRKLVKLQDAPVELFELSNEVWN